MLGLFQHLDIKEFTATSKTGSTALVELDFDGEKSYCLIMPKRGDQISVAVKGVLRDYDIVSAS